MKILVFTDVHANALHLKKIEEKVRKEKPDIIIDLGDTASFGRYLKAVLKRLNNLKKPVYILPGNPPHETEPEVQKACKAFKNLKYIHRKILKINDYTLVFHGGGGFYHGKKGLMRDEDFDKFIKGNKTKLKGKILFFTHAPPAYTKIDYLDWMNGHAGCPSYAAFIKKYKPILSLSGHLHENFTVKQKIGKTLVCNPGPQGMVFKL